MEDDDDNDEREEDNNDDEEDTPTRTYSKKKLFGKTTKEPKPLTLRTYYKPKQDSLKNLKVSIQQTVSKWTHPFTSNSSLKLQHKATFESATIKTKGSLNLRSLLNIYAYDLSQNLSKKISDTTLALNWKVNHKQELTGKLTHSLRLLHKYKLKYGTDLELKRVKPPLYCFLANLELKRTINSAAETPNQGSTSPSSKWWQFLSNYNESLNLGVQAKSNSRLKLQTLYKGHLTTTEKHKLYLQHKFSYEPHNATRFFNTVTANFQDSLGIGTLNGSLSFENLTLKNREFRFVVEFEKSLVLGFQKRNDLLEFIVQKNKIKYQWLKNVRLSVGNKGLFCTCEGKLNLLRTNYDYCLAYKLKPIQQNFYDDSTLGLTLKWNF